MFLHLKRFKFNHDKNCKEKLYSYFEYYHELDFRKYMTMESSACVYTLGGVIVHEGSIDNGHFYSIVRDRKSGVSNGQDSHWFEMDDDWVGRFDMENLFDDTFGHQVDSEVECGEGDEGNEGDEEYLATVPCAYILVYDRVI